MACSRARKSKNTFDYRLASAIVKLRDVSKIRDGAILWNKTVINSGGHR